MSLSQRRLLLAYGACALLLAATLPVQGADLLRAGAGSTLSPSSSSVLSATSSGLTPVGPKASDSLARSAAAIAAVQSMQSAARAAAVAGPNNLGADPIHLGKTLSNVPDGLIAGGLQPAAGTDPLLWQGAALPTQSTLANKTQVEVKQSSQQALLTWDSFNIGKNTTLTFDQSAGGDNRTEWIAFNKISDPSAVPSQILGAIKADGQVYVLNQNGIIFGGSSQVNVHTLVASSLPINTNLVSSGLLNNADQQFLFSSVPLAAGANGTPAFTPPAALTPDAKSGDVTVQLGAQLTSPTTAEHVGGRIALFAPNVTNAGTLSTPDGQTLLAAGQQIGLVAHNSDDPSLRGLDVYVGAGGGTVTNSLSALIDAPRGNITLAGKTLNQLGAVASSTSVAFNGRIDLLANYNAVSSGGLSGLAPFFPQATGVITLGPNSITQVLPEYSSTDRVVGSQLALPSQLNLQGLAVYLAPKAQLLAPSAQLNVSAGNWNLTGTGATAQDAFTFTGGQIYLDTGASIDVAGSANVAASVEDNIVSVQLRGSELADSPLQRDSVLRGQTVQIDIRQTGSYNGQTWIGTPLANTTGYVGLVDHTVAQLTTAGGSVSLQAGNSVVLQPGSSINVSGGWTNYQGGNVATTKLLADGRIIDISQATPDRIYEGIYSGSTTTSSAKWGVNDTSSNPQLLSSYESGYTQGGSGGSLAITAPAMALDGSLLGSTFAGTRQRTALPALSSLALAFKGQDPALPQNLFPYFSPTPPAIVFQSDVSAPIVNAFTGSGIALPVARTQNLVLSPTLFTTAGFGVLSLNNSDGSITVPAGVSLALAPGGALSWSAAQLSIDGKISAPGGSLNFSVFDRSPFADRALTGGAQPAAPVINPNRGTFKLGSAATLSAAGLIIDDRPTNPGSLSQPLLTTGGSITIKSFNTSLATGSLIDASGGLALSASGKVSYGNAGRLTIEAGQDPGFASLLGGHLSLLGQLQAYSGAKGGALSLSAPSVQIGGTTSDPDTLLLSPDFFSSGGFNSYSIAGLGAPSAQPDRYTPGILITPGTQIQPIVVSRLLASSATSPQDALSTQVQPAGVRSPVNLSFSAPGVRDIYNSAKPLVVRGDFVMGEGALISSDPLAQVVISGDTVLVQGKISAPGGSISVSAGKDSTVLFTNTSVPLPTLDLGAKSVLSSAGTTLLKPDARGYRTGSVLAGGTISISGNIVAEAGAKLDVSGAVGTLDLAPTYSTFSAISSTSTSGAPVISTRVESNGGTLALSGGQELFTDASFLGGPGGASALGGNLIITSGKFYPPGTSTSAQQPSDVTLTVTQSGITIAPQNLPVGQTFIGNPVRNASGALLPGQGYFSADSFMVSGLDALTLKGTLQFVGPVSLSAARSLTVATSGLLFANSNVSLSAPYVAVGTAFASPLLPQEISSAFSVQGQPFYVSPSYGPGSLTLNASLIDVGNLSLQNIGLATLNAPNGDIRGDGTFHLAGDVVLRAGQIYPPSAVSFNLIAYDYTTPAGPKTGSILIAAGASRTLPLSAGGDLNLYASTINQNGVLRAPIGGINLGWDGTGTAPHDLISNKNVPLTQELTLGSGSVTSVSALDPITGKAAIIPYGTNLNGTAWIDPSSSDITVGGLPEKTVNLSAQNVTQQPNATVDIRGGGDLFAYRWITGVGGTKDILASPQSFAVLPGYQAGYAPFAAFNPTTLNANFGGDPGYVNSKLSAGDRIYLSGVVGLPAGVYTLLPARYALLAGAFLVTPKTGEPPPGVVTQPDGSSVVAGYRFNDLTSTRSLFPLAAAFELTPQSVVRSRAEYSDSLANTFLSASALANDGLAPRLPLDSGQLVFAATKSMAIQGSVAAQAAVGGRGGLVDISSPIDILIASSATAAPAGTLILNPSELNAFGAESLLIGGIRSSTNLGTALAVKTATITLNNVGTPLVGSEIILAANQAMNFAAGVTLAQVGAQTNRSDLLLFGNKTVPGSGDGLLVRVSSDPSALILRNGVSATSSATLSIGAGAKISGASVTLDSTRTITLSPSATLSGQAIALGSGQITLQLANAGTLPVTTGLTLTGGVLQGLQSAQSVSLLSYSTIDIYGTGAIGALDASAQPLLSQLALHAAGLRGFNTAGGTVSFAAKDILIDNSTAAVSPPGSSTATPSGTLEFNATTFRFGVNPLLIEQFAGVTVNASAGVLGQGNGSLNVQGNLSIKTPLLTGSTAANQALSATGSLTLSPLGSTASVTPGLGASLALTGSSVTDSTTIALPSGSLTLLATSGNLALGSDARLDLSGTVQTFYDLTKYTSAGQVMLSADRGNVTFAAGSIVSVAPAASSTAAGLISVAAPFGTFEAAGALFGAGGSFSLDVGAVPGGSLAALNTALDAAGLTLARSLRVRTGNVILDTRATAQSFNLSADQGSITVTAQGLIDASGLTGGSIALSANAALTLQAGSKLSVAGQNFNSAGKGGSVTLETRGAGSSLIEVQSGSIVDLSVNANTLDSSTQGNFTGTLRLRAPQTNGGNDLALAPINGTLLGASSIILEGYKIYDLSSSNGSTLSASVQAAVMANGTAFTANTSTITNRLLASNRTLSNLIHVRPGAEIINPLGDLTLASAWDLSSYRFGPNLAEPGSLTLRAAGNLNFDYSYNALTRIASIGSLSDGFGGASSYGLWDAPMLSPGSQSWSYRLIAGADFAAADFRRVKPIAALSSSAGSLLLGRNTPPLPLPANPNSPNSSANLRQNIIPNFYQVIRTGTGDIDIAAARDLQLLNPIAAIYTAGTQANALANFDLPRLTDIVRNSKLGPTQDPIYPAYYSLAGGNINISAQRDIIHLVPDAALSSLIADSSKELPSNWLYRRGYIDPVTGQFAATHSGGEIASTSWWVDFSNFFEGVGALGGGNLTLLAGRTISNVDAVIPTNARMPKGAPDLAKLVELGGGDLIVRAGADIDGGVYYVERGKATLSAGGSIHTNNTRAGITQASAVALENAKLVANPTSWLPTTLYLGKGSVEVSARGDLLLGSIVNPFLLPQGVNNNAYNKSYFSTYAADDTVNLSSLTGSLTLRANPDGRAGSLSAWFQNVQLYDEARHQTYSSYSQPWLRLLETDITPFFTVDALFPGALRATAFSGDINLVGTLNLAPSAQGTVELLASKSLNGLQANGVNDINNKLIWGSSLINLSDADPRRLPGVASPLALAGSAATSPTVTPIELLDSLNALFNESGSSTGIYGVIQTKQALHAAGPLHLADLSPARLYAKNGSISGLTFFSAKASRVSAGRDITDVALYLQNNRPSDLSVVTAGRDLIAFDLNSPLRSLAQSSGNELLVGSSTLPGPATGNPTAGDIQISGPGTLEVLAGRNFYLGVGAGAGDGTAVGISSIGNGRNPNLPFSGASIIAGAGLGPVSSLADSSMNFTAFIAKFLDPASAGPQSARYLPALRLLLSAPTLSDAQTWSAFKQLPLEKRNALALDLFYQVLRDAGRDHGLLSSVGYRNYDAGFAAIAALFPGNTWKGDFSLTSREIKTASGGDINLFAPGGSLTVGFDITGSQPIDQGILTEHGGNISIFTRNSVIVGTSRIFTLRGGDEIIWSSRGNIAAGASSKTVQSAPPTRVLIDPQSGDVKTDLAGLATGGGIGVLATVVGVKPGDVDLIAPTGTIDAGDAGIRVSGNLNISALQVVNAANIQVSGSSAGTPAPVAPAVGGLAATASSASAAGSSAAENAAKQARAQAQSELLPSLITVEVLGYGGGDGEEKIVVNREPTLELVGQIRSS